MAWESIAQLAKLNQAHAEAWKIRRAELCPVCEQPVVRNTCGSKGCTFCEWTESSGVVFQP